MTLGSIFHLLGYLAGAGALWMEARRRGLATEGIGILVLAGLMGSLLGARVAHVIWTRDIGQFLQGKSLLGGVFGGWLCVELAKRWTGIRRSTGDLFVPALLLGEAVGRIGCHLNPCCYGMEFDGWFCVHQAGENRFPSQLVSGGVALIGFGLWRWARDWFEGDGETFAWYLLWFGVTRFGLEFLRFRSDVFFGLSSMQWLSLELIGFVFVRRWWKSRARLVG